MTDLLLDAIRRIEALEARIAKIETPAQPFTPVTPIYVGTPPRSVFPTEWR